MSGNPTEETHYNPCLIGRKKWLALIGDTLAVFFVDWFEEPTNGCPCCMAVRILLFAGACAALGAGAGTIIGSVL